jgi:hypothetical protein
MLNTGNTLKCPFRYHRAYKFTSSLEVFPSTIRGEMAVLHPAEVMLTTDSSSAATKTRKQTVLNL